MTTWAPPDADLMGSEPAAPTWAPPEVDAPELPGGGTRVANPGTEAFASGVIEGGGAAAGIYAGARLGQAAGPYGMAAGAVLGAVVGSEAGQGLREAVGLRTPQQMAPDQRSLAEFTYSLGGGAAAAATPFGAAAVGLQLLENGSRVGRWLMGAVRQAQRTPKTFAAVEGSAVLGAAAGAGIAETLDPGDALTRFGGELAGGLFLDPVGKAVTAWNVGNRAFSAAMGKYGRNATEVKFGQQLVAAIKEAGDDPEQVIRVLEAGNPYGLTAAQLTADPVLMAAERALVKKSDVFAQDLQLKAKKAREAMTAQINILKLDGNPEHLGTIAALRKAQFDTLMSEPVKAAEARAKEIIRNGVRKGMSDEDLGDISARAREAVDSVRRKADKYTGQLYDAVKLNIPVKLTNIEAVVNDKLARSADRLRSEKVPPWLMDTIKDARKAAGTRTTYDPGTFVITETPGEIVTDSRTMLDLRRRLLSVSLDPNAKDFEKDLATDFQTAILKDLDEAFKEGMDDSYDIARAAYRAKKDVFSRSFAGTAASEGKRGDVVNERLLLQRAFATGKEAASLKLKDLEEATRFMVTRGMGDDGATDVMLKAQEEALRLISTASMKDGRINPATMDEYLRTNGALFNREPFISVRDDLREAIKSEEGISRLVDFVKRRQSDIGRNSAFAKISGSNPVDYASRILVSSGDQETMFTKMFNMAKKGGTNKQGVQVVTPEQGISSARASVLNAAFERSKQGSVFNLDTFRELLFVPRVSGQKSPITIMREQGVMTPEHVSNLSKLFNSLETLKIAERQGFGMDPKQSVGEIGLVLGAKIMASKAASALQRATGQSGASIIVAGAVAKAAETVVSKIPAARVQDVAILLMNDPKALANVMRKETTAQGRMLQVQRFHSWLIQTGVTANRDFGPVEMFSQQESTP